MVVGGFYSFYFSLPYGPGTLLIDDSLWGAII